MLLSAIVERVLTVTLEISSLIKQQPAKGTRGGRSSVAGCCDRNECDGVDASGPVTTLSGARGVAAPLTG